MKTIKTSFQVINKTAQHQAHASLSVNIARHANEMHDIFASMQIRVGIELYRVYPFSLIIFFELTCTIVLVRGSRPRKYVHVLRTYVTQFQLLIAYSTPGVKAHSLINQIHNFSFQRVMYTWHDNPN